ncbi:MAG: ribosome biogenesis GTPase Der [Alphaproteobacteria bacterium]|nr:ribosome biogenesis GTPase Der [Alphaproteobacteria bacterium]
MGRPNVGKSTLFNVLAIGKENKAIAHAQAGTTRDVRQTPAQLFGRPFVLLDTAGVEPARTREAATALQRQLNQLSLQAAQAADVLLLLLDGAAPLTPADRALATDLRKLNKPLIVVVNKADLRVAERTVAEAATLGLGPVIALSAAHREGLGQLADALDPYLPAAVEAIEQEAEPTPAATDLQADGTDATLDALTADPALPTNKLISKPLPTPLKLAVLGRPNVGKSTLVNALLRQEAMLTGPVAGLTREAITHTFTALGHRFALIDTPGLRKKGKVEEDSLEFLSVGQSLAALQHAHVLLLVIDASVHNEARGLWQVFEQQDAAIAQAALRAQKPIIVVLNKWDAVHDKDACKADVLAQLRAKLHGIHTPLALPVSATRQQGLGALLKAVLELQSRYGQAFNTAKLNRTLAAILAKRSPPLINGQVVSLKFLRQIVAGPPVFALWGNRVDKISGHYLQFLKHQLCENLGLTALPITLHLRANQNPFGHRAKQRAGFTGSAKQKKAQAAKTKSQKSRKPRA